MVVVGREGGVHGSVVNLAKLKAQARRTAARNASIRAGSFRPAPRSTPEETSTIGAPLRPDRVADIPRVQAPRQEPRPFEPPTGQQRPVERRAEPRPDDWRRRASLASNIRPWATSFIVARARSMSEASETGQDLDQRRRRSCPPDLLEADAGLSRPWSWISSGAEGRRSGGRVRSSPGSATTTATILALPRAGRARAAAASGAMSRGLAGKNMKPMCDAPPFKRHLRRSHWSSSPQILAEAVMRSDAGRRPCEKIADVGEKRFGRRRRGGRRRPPPAF